MTTDPQTDLTARIAAKKAEPHFQELAKTLSAAVPLGIVQAQVLRDAAAEIAAMDPAEAALAGQYAFHNAAAQLHRRANEAEFAATPCDAINPCEDGGDPCHVHERLMSHYDGSHELCELGCETAAPAAAPAVSSPLPDQTLRDRIASALYERERPPRDPAWAEAYAMDRETFEEMADAIMPLLPESADQGAVDPDCDGDELTCVDMCGSCDACGMEPFGTPAEGWRQAAQFLRRTARDAGNRAGSLHAARLIEAELRRLAAEAQQEPDDTDLTETDIDRMMAAGIPVQIVTAPPNTRGAEAQQPDTETRTSWTPGPVALARAAEWATKRQDATVDPAMCPRCKGDNSEAFELCARCAAPPAVPVQPAADDTSEEAGA